MYECLEAPVPADVPATPSRTNEGVMWNACAPGPGDLSAYILRPEPNLRTVLHVFAIVTVSLQHWLGIDFPSPPDYACRMASDTREGVITMSYQTQSVEGCTKCEGVATVTLSHNGGRPDGTRECGRCGYWEEFDGYYAVWASGYRK